MAATGAGGQPQYGSKDFTVKNPSDEDLNFRLLRYDPIRLDGLHNSVKWRSTAHDQ